MSKIRIIVNPSAGQGHAVKLVPQVEKTLSELRVDHSVVYTERVMHAAELAMQAAGEGYDIVAAMGGDGTANEVLNGLMAYRKKHGKTAALAVIGAGRGNDFAYGAGLPSSLEEDCRLLQQGKRRSIDIGSVTVDDAKEARCFGNGIGMGFDTVVGFEAAKMKHLTGFPAYLVAALKTLFFYFTPPTVRIKLDDDEFTQPALMVSVMNGQRMGGGFYMAPDGKNDDGLLDYCIVGYPSKLRILALMLKFMKGTQAAEKEVRTGRTRRIEITALEGSLPAHGDGETLCEEGKSIVAEIIPAALDVIVP
ncbi:diacylglycerol kinase family lipid kinase [bacterium]|nr:diacylglycerol kinase family lipid kinase [bacterium]